MIAYAKYKTKTSILEISTTFSILLDDSRTCSELLFGIKKESPMEFMTFPETSLTIHFKFLDD